MIHQPRGLAARLSTDQLLRGSVNLVANNLSATALGFLGWVVAARLFPVAAVGLAGATISVASLTANVALVGAPGTLLRFLPGAQDRTRLVRTALGVTTSAGAALALGVVALRPPQSEGAADLVVAAIFVLFVLALVTKAVTEAAVIAGRASQVALAATVAANATKIVALGTLGWLAAGAYGILAAQAVAALLNAAVLTRHLRRVGLLRGGLAVDLYAVRRVGGYAGSQYVNGLAGGLPLLVLPVLVKANLGDRMAGFWYIASLIATAMSLVSSGVGQSLLVESSHDTTQAERLARRALRGLVVLSVPSVAAALVFAPWILTVFGPGYAREALATFRILAISTLLSPVIYVLGTMFFVRRRIVPLLVVNLANAVVVLGLASRATSLPGIAWAWLLGEVVYVALFLAMLPLFPARTTDPAI